MLFSFKPLSLAAYYANKLRRVKEAQRISRAQEKSNPIITKARYLEHTKKCLLFFLLTLARDKAGGLAFSRGGERGFALCSGLYAPCSQL